MIRRYLPTETTYTHNKFVLSPLRAEVDEEANGLFEIELEFPRGTVINKRDIISAPTPRGEQPFRVYRTLKSLNGIRVFARHLFYDLADSLLIQVGLTNRNVTQALQNIFTSLNLQGYTGWTYSSDILTVKTTKYNRMSPIEIMLGAHNSIINYWGGNLVRDKKDIKILASGVDRGFEIRLGKNLIGIEDDSDDSEVVTRLYPTYEKDSLIYGVPGTYPQAVDSPLIGNYPHPIEKEIRVPLTDDEKNFLDADIRALLYAYCNKLFSVNKVDKPGVNYKIDFVALSKIATIPQEQKYTVAGLEQLTYETIETLTYDQIEGTDVIQQFINLMEELDLYDTITIKVKELDIDVKAMVISYKYDAIAEKYLKIEVGNFKVSNKYTTESIVRQIKTNEISRVSLA